jgi:hypothetical protein
MAASAGCSLIDAYGTVVTETASDAGHGGEDGSIRKGKDASTEDARKGLETGTQAEAEPTDTGEEDAGPPTGAIVVSGEGTVDGGLEYVLAVLDPTGNELSREKMAVVGITFDGLLPRLATRSSCTLASSIRTPAHGKTWGAFRFHRRSPRTTWWL